MFDIEEYYSPDDSRPVVNIQHIEQELEADIEQLSKNNLVNLYTMELFKQAKHSIEILFPSLELPGPKSLLKGPDHVRFLLSLVPRKELLADIDRIVLRPRHVLLGNTELMALYLRRQKTLVLYLYYPHVYSQTGADFFKNGTVTDKTQKSSDQRSVDFERYLFLHTLWGTKIEDSDNVKIPPLLHLLELISSGGENDIDKFFVRIDAGADRSIINSLNEISYFYSRHGY